MRLVYFARVVGTVGPIKIGCSTAPRYRCKQLGFDVAASIEVIATAPGDYMLERNLHLKFAAYQTKGPTRTGRTKPAPGHNEWFAASPELLTFISEIVRTGTIALAPGECRERVFAERYLAGETLQQIANDYGITRERVRQVLRNTGVETLGLRPEHRSKPHPLSAHEREAAKLYEQRQSPKEICARFGLTRSQLLSVCDRLGIQHNRVGGLSTFANPEFVSARIAALYRQGVSSAQIAKQFGFSHQTYVYRWLKRAGVQPRTRKGRFGPRKAAA